VAPLTGALGVAIAVLALPRLAWIAMAAALVVWCAGAAPERAGLLAVAALPVPLLLRRAPSPTWSLPAAAPLLGLAGLAGAYPALAARAGRPLHRAAAGALGAWWLLLAEAALDRRLMSPHGVGGPASAGGWHAIQAAATSPSIAVAGVWAVAAVVLPHLVRGRLLVVDLVGATAWAAGLAAGTHGALGAAPRGFVVAAILAGGLAVALRPSRAAPLSR
jgi:hypothetical protein